MESQTVHKIILIKADCTTTWRVLTTPAIMKTFFFGCDVVTSWKEGSPILFQSQGIVHVKGTITRFSPKQCLEYTAFSPLGSLPDHPSSYTSVTFTLTSKPEGTELTVTQGPFQGDMTRFYHADAGWDMILKGLKERCELESMPCCGGSHSHEKH